MDCILVRKGRQGAPEVVECTRSRRDIPWARVQVDIRVRKDKQEAPGEKVDCICGGCSHRL